MVLVYDGSLEGYFTAVFEAYRIGSQEIRFQSESKYTADLFNEKLIVRTDKTEAKRVLTGIHNRLERYGLNLITRAFLCEQEGSEDTVYRFIRKGMKSGKAYIDDLTDPDALGVMQMAQKTGKEYHRFLGLIRFRKLSTGEYYAPFEPDTNLIPLLARHFASRFPDQAWMIHDRKRNTALVHIGGRLEIITSVEIPLFPENTDEWAKLWQIYHEKIGIEERKNPKLQMQFMPKKHWNYLPEME